MSKIIARTIDYIENDWVGFDRMVKISTDIRTIYVNAPLFTLNVEIYRYFHSNYGLKETIVELIDYVKCVPIIYDYRKYQV